MQIKGFTLLEILIALLVFTILSLMLVSALHNVIQAQEGAERTASRLRETQLMWLIVSRDIEQIINRPIITGEDKQEPAFLGGEKAFTFTHMGMANVITGISSLQRVQYSVTGKSFTRTAWPILDRLEQTKAKQRNLLSDIKSVRFEYFDREGKAKKKWPPEEGNDPLPSGIRITLNTFYGTMSQSYVVPANPSPLDSEQKPDEKEEGKDPTPDAKQAS